MSIYILICAIVACLFSLAGFIFSLLNHLKLPKLYESLGKSISNKILESEERQVQVNTITGQAIRQIEEQNKIDKKELAHTVCKQSAEMQRIYREETSRLADANEAVVAHMSTYSAVLESQDRLIQAVSDLVEAKSSARRRG